MSLYSIIFIIVTFFILLGLGLFFLFISWLDKKIDQKDRLGSSAYKEKVKNKKQKDNRISSS